MKKTQKKSLQTNKKLTLAVNNNITNTTVHLTKNQPKKARQLYKPIIPNQSKKKQIPITNLNQNNNNIGIQNQNDHTLNCSNHNHSNSKSKKNSSTKQNKIRSPQCSSVKQNKYNNNSINNNNDGREKSNDQSSWLDKFVNGFQSFQQKSKSLQQNLNKKDRSKSNKKNQTSVNFIEPLKNQNKKTNNVKNQCQYFAKSKINERTSIAKNGKQNIDLKMRSKIQQKKNKLKMPVYNQDPQLKKQKINEVIIANQNSNNNKNKNNFQKKVPNQSALNKQTNQKNELAQIIQDLEVTVIKVQQPLQNSPISLNHPAYRQKFINNNTRRTQKLNIKQQKQQQFHHQMKQKYQQKNSQKQYKANMRLQYKITPNKKMFCKKQDEQQNLQLYKQQASFNQKRAFTGKIKKNNQFSINNTIKYNGSYEKNEKQLEKQTFKSNDAQQKMRTSLNQRNEVLRKYKYSDKNAKDIIKQVDEDSSITFDNKHLQNQRVIQLKFGQIFDELDQKKSGIINRNNCCTELLNDQVIYLIGSIISKIKYQQKQYNKNIFFEEGKKILYSLQNQEIKKIIKSNIYNRFIGFETKRSDHKSLSIKSKSKYQKQFQSQSFFLTDRIFNESKNQIKREKSFQNIKNYSKQINSFYNENKKQVHLSESRIISKDPYLRLISCQGDISMEISNEKKQKQEVLLNRIPNKEAYLQNSLWRSKLMREQQAQYRQRKDIQKIQNLTTRLNRYIIENRLKQTQNEKRNRCEGINLDFMELKKHLRK